MENESNLIYGRIPVILCLKAKRRKVYRLYLQEGVSVPEIKPFLTSLPVEYKPRNYLDRLTKNGVHQGVVAEVEPLLIWKFEEWCRSEALQAKDIVILDHIEDPRNLGAIIRSAVAFKLDAVLITREGSAPISPVTVKASAGAVEFATLVEIGSTPKTIKRLKELDFKIVGLDRGGDISIKDVDWNEKNAIIIGSEGKGIRPVVKSLLDITAYIPTDENVSQLNASVSAGVAFYALKNS